MSICHLRLNEAEAKGYNETVLGLAHPASSTGICKTHTHILTSHIYSTLTHLKAFLYEDW